MHRSVEESKLVEPLLSQLIKRHPEQFSASDLDFQPVQGWLPLFVRLCADVSLLPENSGGFVHWVQVKDKLGSLRARYRVISGVDDTLAQALRERVAALCERSRVASETCCQSCSRPAPRIVPAMPEVLCAYHRAQQLRDPEQYERDLQIRIDVEIAQIDGALAGR